MIVTVLFAITAAVAIGAALMMVFSSHSVHSALFLVATQISLAVLFLLLGAFFIAALQVIVYAGAIMVLFIFVIMLLGVDREEILVEPLGFQRPIGLLLGLALVGEAVFIGLRKGLDFATTLGSVTPTDAIRGSEGNVEAIARVLFTRWAFPFEATSVLLVVAVVGVMVLAKRRARP